jgi:sirohydrochlorin cobaltochelatase
MLSFNQGPRRYRSHMHAVVVLTLRVVLCGIVVACLSCASATPSPARPELPAQPAGQAQPSVGVMLMAHGGDDAWNRTIIDMVALIQQEMPVEVAFGMAAPSTMQQAVEKLERRGATRIVVVRLFISGESFVGRTEQILGLKPGAPPRPAQSAHAAHGEHAGHDMALWKVDSRAQFVLTPDGLMDADAMGEVLADRAQGLSRKPKQESVLVVGHGPETDEENARWLARMDRLADTIRKRAPFRDVHVETLREDWPERRKAAEARIRAYVERAGARGGTAIVIPFRVAGFGPYAEVLKGLEYVADEKGLLPSAQVVEWIRDEAKKAGRQAGWLK